MPADPIKRKPSDASTLRSIADLLACPVCLGELRLEQVRLVCAGCGRAYPIVDGIPVLIAGRENPLA